MKTTLIIEQSAELIRRGVSADKASMSNATMQASVNARGIIRIPGQPIFTLVDTLSLLPKYLAAFGNLMMDFNNLYKKWDVCYELSEYMQSEAELIDALYSLLCWVIDNGYIDLTK